MRELQIGNKRSEVGCSCHLAPLGIPTLLIADDPFLLQAGAAPFAAWEADAQPERPAITLRLSRGALPTANVDFRITVEGSRVTVSGGGIFGWADARLRQGECLLQGRHTGNPTVAFKEATETLLLFLLARADRTPIHASAVVMGERALILAGPSGTGKSTLALLAAQRGLQVLSDDVVYIQTDPQIRVWGLGGPVHVCPEDAPPDASDSRLRNGKLKLVVPLPNSPGRELPIERATLILLKSGRRLELSQTGAAAASKRLARLEPGFDLLRKESEVAIRALLSAGDAWQLTLSRDPAAALDMLCETFGSA